MAGGSPIYRAWENDRDNFTEVDKTTFDTHCRNGEFDTGPLRTEHSDWMREFGPYDPERWAFGELKDGRRICAKIA